RAVLRSESLRDVERLPGRLVLILADAVGVLTRMAEGGLVDPPRAGAANVHQRQPNRPPDGRVCHPALTEAVWPAVDLELLAEGTVDDDQRRRDVGRALDSVQVEAVVEQRFDRREHDWQMLRAASGHNGVHGQALDGRLAPLRWNPPDQVIGRFAA